MLQNIVQINSYTAFVEFWPSTMQFIKSNWRRATILSTLPTPDWQNGLKLISLIRVSKLTTYTHTCLKQ